MIRLDQIEKNQIGRIVEINTDMLPLKLIEMGCLPGNEVSLKQLAPLNDPMYLIIQRLSLGNSQRNSPYTLVN
jgi:ferrous iron transport protein A